MTSIQETTPASPVENEARFSPVGDINTAAALRAQYAIQTPKAVRRRHRKKLDDDDDDTPLLDNTVSLVLHSKKTERSQRRQQKKAQKTADAPAATGLADLPSELLMQVLCDLQVSDIFRLSRASRTIQKFVLDNEKSIAKEVVSRRYWILQRCFPLPIPFDEVPENARAGLLNEKRQDMLNIHRKSYHQHIEMIDPHAVCTCMTCVFAWNNLCLVVDLCHWQPNLKNREPIPMIQRGSTPEWNQELLRKNADTVRKAMHSSLWYAAILERHLDTTMGTILRSSRWRKPGTKAKPRLYHMTDWDVEKRTDAFLDRSGPASYDFPFHRDNYYSIEIYLPNRKYGVDGRWHYYPPAPTQHEKDLDWVRATHWTNMTPEKRRQALANLKDHNIRWSQYMEKAQNV